MIVEKGFVALADGVGGWDEDGVDPAAYSQALVANCVAAREVRGAAPYSGHAGVARGSGMGPGLSYRRISSSPVSSLHRTAPTFRAGRAIR